jgi:rifampicin phosphotransferase
VFTIVRIRCSRWAGFGVHDRPENAASARKFEQGRQEASKKEQELLGRLRQLPDGEQKASETKQMISLIRNFIGYREYPKYDIVSRYFLLRQALLREAELLVQAVNGRVKVKENDRLNRVRG